MKTFKRFQVSTEGLSEKEKIIQEKLIRASELISLIYEKQKNPKNKGANFFPKDVTKEKIKEAAEKNPFLLHPYTLVEKDKKGRLIAIPFSVKFKKELGQVAKLIIEAARISENREFGKYLGQMAQALLRNDYAQNEILWVTSKPFRFNFIIGPVERYLDRLFFKKCAYQAWLGIIDEQRTQEAERFKKIILASRRKILTDTEKIALPQLRIEITKTICFAGQKVDFMPTGSNLPNSPDLMKKYGSKLIIFENSLDFQFKQDQLPIVHKIFPKKIQDSYSPQDLYDASLRCILLHEISHSLIRYQDAEERLQNLFPVFDEILAYVLGVKSCGTLLLKGAMTQKELEAVMVMHLCRHFVWFLDFMKNPEVKDYTSGAAIAMNFFLKEGGLKEKNELYFIDFTKLFISIDHLARILEYYLSSGTYEEAKKFINEYGSFDVFKKSFLKLKTS